MYPYINMEVPNSHMKHHLEQKEDEIYMGNVDPDHFMVGLHTSWITSRFGNIVKEFRRMQPWFIQRKEVQSKLRLERNPDIAKIWIKMLETNTAFYERV